MSDATLDSTRRSTWVFGYGSLVAPASIARTIGRPVDRSDGFAAARTEKQIVVHGSQPSWESRAFAIVLSCMNDVPS